ncbi:BI1-like protein [Olea europaea var. sylvestris]|uniref:BI1-like protein n=1 Tax=Olea europaea var. sylvestris TaxID=158386 RepID=UPI000C1D04B2|nr:BI1-like protein [Olea europaea var. sylvestris]
MECYVLLGEMMDDPLLSKYRDGVSESQFARVMSVEQYLLIQIIHHWFESAKHKIYVRPVSILFTTSGASLALYIVLIITPFIVLCPLYYYYLKHLHLVNYFWLGLLTTTVGFMVGFTCAFSSGKRFCSSFIYLFSCLFLEMNFKLWLYDKICIR